MLLEQGLDLTKLCISQNNIAGSNVLEDTLFFPRYIIKSKPGDILEETSSSLLATYEDPGIGMT